MAKKLKILVIGSGGREHAVVWKISRSKKVKKIYTAPGNPGTAKLAENIGIDASDINGLIKFAKEKKIDLTFVGPEGPLIDGIVDKFTANKLAIIGPSKKAAAIEGSKIFAKKMISKYGIPTAKFQVFTDYKKAVFYVQSQKYPLVLKADGQCFGKGVKVAKNKEEAQDFLEKLLVQKIFGQSGNKVIIEEYLEGPEISFMLATDGDNFVSLIPSQDHKRVFDKDTGPNTGGMGAFAPLPFVGKKLIKRIEKEIVIPALMAMKKEGYPYKGILYPGLILTSQGPKVLEFNCRFGDPETQSVLSLLKTDIIDLFQAIIKGKIDKLKLSWHTGYAVCVVLSADGYPGKYQKGQQIRGLEKIKNAFVFHSGTKESVNKIVASGGRVLGIAARGNSLKNAIKNAYKSIGKNGIHFSGMHYRKDIGQKGLNKKLWKMN